MSTPVSTPQPPASRAQKVLVWLWYLPILITLSVGFLVSNSDLAPRLTDKAKVFQNSQDASSEFVEIGRSKFGFTLALDQSFSVDGYNFRSEGSFREGDSVRIPLPVTSPGPALSSVRLQVLDGEENPLLAGLLLSVRECSREWVEGACAGEEREVLPSSKLTDDTYQALTPGDFLAEGETRHLLVELAAEEGIIVPVKGYEAELQVITTGLAAAAPTSGE